VGRILGYIWRKGGLNSGLYLEERWVEFWVISGGKMGRILGYIWRKGR
jgi:endonuclease YncB( thermonuclease family)